MRPGRRLPFAAPERTIVMRLRWGSGRNLEDALAMYPCQQDRPDLRAVWSFGRRNLVERDLGDLEDRPKDLSPS